MTDTVRVPTRQLHLLYQQIFGAIGCSGTDATTMADALLAADLRGLETHGAWRVPQYVRLAQAGTINPTPAIQSNQTGPATATVDGDNAFGQIAGQHGLDLALNLAADVGTAAVTVANTNHVGMLYYYANQAAQAGFVSFIVANSPPNMAPWGGTRAVLGTNPICIACPGPGADPIVLDMATSVAAKAKILVAAKTGRDVPEGWALDANGEPTTDAQRAAEGTVQPIGGPKGYGLALMVDILAGVLAGAGFGLDAYYAKQPKRGGMGMFINLFAVGRFIEPASFQRRLQSLVAMLKETPTAPWAEAIYLPGERELARMAEQERLGVSLSPEVAADLQETALTLGLNVQGVVT